MWNTMCMEVDRSMACQKNYDEKDYCWHPCACYIDTKYRPKLPQITITKNDGTETKWDNLNSHGDHWLGVSSFFRTNVEIKQVT